ncbi:MAG: translation factor Sua5, partial [Deltaproteobacteria bacterium]
MNRKIIKADPAGIRKVARVILRGGVAAFPTETFYGLGADA